MRRRCYVLLLAAVVIGLMFLPWTYLAVIDGNNRLILQPFLGPNRRFSLKYRHSVQKTVCWEDFIVGENGELVLVGTRYESLGVGLPFQVGEGLLINKEGQFHLTGLKRPFPSLSLRAMPIAEQALVVRGRTYEFNDFFAPGAIIDLKAERLSTFQVLCYKLSKGGSVAW